MSSQLVAIADGVVTKINAASLSQVVTAARSYVATGDLEDANTLSVDVMPVDMTKSLQNRSGKLEQYQVRVVIQKRTDSDTNATLDALSVFVEELADLLLGARITTPNVICVSTEIVPFAVVDIRERNQFAASITATYQQIR